MEEKLTQIEMIMDIVETSNQALEYCLKSEDVNEINVIIADFFNAVASIQTAAGGIMNSITSEFNETNSDLNRAINNYKIDNSFGLAACYENITEMKTIFFSWQKQMFIALKEGINFIS